MQVDLTDAAKAYGLSYVPEVVFDYLEPGNATFDDLDHIIHVDPDFFSSSEMTSEYSEHRFTAAGAPRLNAEDAARFILAHELWHARQFERDPAWTRRATFRENMMSMVLGGNEIHDGATIETSADKHAAKVYPLVKLVR